MKTAVRLMLATLLLLGAMSTSSLAEGGDPPPCVRRGIAKGIDSEDFVSAKLLVGCLVCE